MQILVTGGGGFLGTYIIRELLKRPHYIITNFSRHNYAHLEDLGVPTIRGDLKNKSDIDRALSQSDFDAIIHVAALTENWGRHRDFLEVNYFGTKLLIDAAKERGVKKFIYTCCSSVVFDKDGLLGVNEQHPYPTEFLSSFVESKAMAERYVLQMNDGKDFLTCSLRPGLLWGPGDEKFLPTIVSRAREGKIKIIGDGENLADILYVENASLAHARALEALSEGSKLCGESYFLGQERPVKFWDFINRILSHYKIDPLNRYIDFKSAYRLGWFFEKSFQMAGIQKPYPPLTRFGVIKWGISHYFSHEKARQDFNFKDLISTDEGLKRTFALRDKVNLSLGQ